MLEFLHEKFSEGKALSTIGVYKAALSNTLKPIDNFAIGAHPHVLAMYKGMCNLKPRQYKKLPAWKVVEVLNTLKSWGANHELDLKRATLKTTMLLALTSGARCSEIADLDTTRMHVHEGIGIEFDLTNKKTHKTDTLPGKMFIPSFIDKEPLLCPVSCLENYFIATGRLGALAFCQTENVETPWESDPVLRKSVPPFTKISPKTVSRWLTMVIAEATEIKLGEKSMGHSTRGKAATEAAFKGLTISQIMKAAEWKSESVFCDHYFQPWFDKKFGRAVLGEQA